MCAHMYYSTDMYLYTDERDIEYRKSFNMYGIVFLKTVCEQDPISKWLELYKYFKDIPN